MTSLDDYMPISPDHNAERLAELKRLFPDLFTNEGRLDADELKRLVEPSELDNEKFRFTWYGKARAKRKAFAPIKGALVYDEARSVNPAKADGNMIIEGENLEVLKLLTSAYMGSVKCIYIDPPYNTGKDFIYPDNYKQERREYWEQEGTLQDGVRMDTNSESSGRYHSDWLSMMYSRLLVARLLLREDGVIFVSIDDNEVHHLRKLMDEVFGEENFVGKFAVQLNPRGRHLDKFLAQTHEYLLVFAKDIATDPLKQLPKNERMLSEYNQQDEQGKYRELGLRNRNPAFNKTTRPKLYYPIYVDPETGNVSLESSAAFSIEVLPLNSSGGDSCWTWGKSKFRRQNKLLVARQTRNGDWRIFRKDYLVKDGKKATTLPKSLWIDKEIHNDYGKKAIQAQFDGENVFDFPKAPAFIKRLLQIGMADGDTVLDFFAGSGVTAQAVVELNQEDHAEREFILVQIPEQISAGSTIGNNAIRLGYRRISDITIERTKRVIEGYGDDPQPLDTGFKVYRLAPSRFPRVAFQPDPDQSEAANIAALQRYISEKEQSFHIAFDREAVFDEVLLKAGFKLTYTLEQMEAFSANEVFLARDGGREALICLDLELADGTVDYFKTHRERIFICLERALDTTKKWNLLHYLGERLKTI